MLLAAALAAVKRAVKQSFNFPLSFLPCYPTKASQLNFLVLVQRQKGARPEESQFVKLLLFPFFVFAVAAVSWGQKMVLRWVKHTQSCIVEWELRLTALCGPNCHNNAKMSHLIKCFFKNAGHIHLSVEQV